MNCRKEEAESRPKLEFIPKSLQDLTLEQICESTEALNGGRFAKPSDFNRARNSKNSLYSSQQNLSQHNRPGSTGSNFSRSKFYGSQQNLQTSAKMSVSSASSVHSMDQNRNPVNGYDANAIDPWLNAWDSPAAIQQQPPPSAAPRHNNSYATTPSAANSAAQFRMPMPPSNGGGGGARNGQSNLNATNNNFVHSNGNNGSSSSGGIGVGNGRQFSNSLSSASAPQQHSNQNSNINNNNYSDPWSGDSLFLFSLFMFITYYVSNAHHTAAEHTGKSLSLSLTFTVHSFLRCIITVVEEFFIPSSDRLLSSSHHD